MENRQRIAKFEKVSFEQYVKDYIDTFGETNKEEIKKIYDSIQLPKRATVGSAGYDFYLPFGIKLLPNEQIKIPTGIRAYMEMGWVLQTYPRSGLGHKYRFQLNNTVGIIDSDYYYSSNEGHIMAKMANMGLEDKTIELEASTAFMQGLFIQYGITLDDEVTEIRDGGFGSTTKKPIKQ